MRIQILPSNVIALPLAFAYSAPFEGEPGWHEFAILIGPISISISWGDTFA